MGLETGRRVEEKTLITAYHFKSHLQSNKAWSVKKVGQSTSLIQSNMHKKLMIAHECEKRRKKVTD